MARAKMPAIPQNTTSQAGASRPRKERSSTASGASMVASLTHTTGAGHSTARKRRQMKPMELAFSPADRARTSSSFTSVDIKTFPFHAQLIDLAILLEKLGTEMVSPLSSRDNDQGLGAGLLKSIASHEFHSSIRLRHVARPEMRRSPQTDLGTFHGLLTHDRKSTRLNSSH